MKDTKGENQVTLAIHSDNMYLCGFKNNHGEWFTFKGYWWWIQDKSLGRLLPSSSASSPS
jgi:hypothetical protein